MAKAHSSHHEVEDIRAVCCNSSEQSEWCLVKWLNFDETHTQWVRTQDVRAPELLKRAREHQSASDAEWTWEYYLDAPMNGFPVGWHPYSGHAQISINKYFREYCKDECAMADSIECVLSGKYQYLINFAEMTQTNVRVAAKTVRKIRCLPKRAIVAV